MRHIEIEPDSEKALSKREGYLDAVGKRQLEVEMDLLGQEIFGWEDRKYDQRNKRLMMVHDNGQIIAWRNSLFEDFKKKGLNRDQSAQLIGDLENFSLENDFSKDARIRRFARKTFK